MRALLPPLESGRKWMVQTTTTPFFLEGTYDPLQVWLPFVEHIYFQVSARKPKTPDDLLAAHKDSLVRIENGANRKHALNSENDRYLFLWQKDVEQRMLPFREHRMIPHKHWARLVRNEYAGWDRTDNGEPMVMEIEYPTDRRYNSAQRRNDAEAWCMEHARGCYYIFPGARAIAFERKEDAMLFKLTYC